MEKHETPKQQELFISIHAKDNAVPNQHKIAGPQP